MAENSKMTDRHLLVWQPYESLVAADKKLDITEQSQSSVCGELQHRACAAHPTVRRGCPQAASTKVNLVSLEAAGTKGREVCSA